MFQHWLTKRILQINIKKITKIIDRLLNKLFPQDIVNIIEEMIFSEVTIPEIEKKILPEIVNRTVNIGNSIAIGRNTIATPWFGNQLSVNPWSNPHPMYDGLSPLGD